MKERINRVRLEGSLESKRKMIAMEGRKGKYSAIPTKWDQENTGRIKRKYWSHIIIGSIDSRYLPTHN